MSRFNQFAEKPFGPLCEHMAKVKECVALVEPMFACLLASDWPGLEKLTQSIFKLEHQADRIKNEIRDEMPRAFALPIFRGDLLAYLKLQDAIADTVEDIGVVLTLKKLTLPEAAVEDLRRFLARVVEVCTILFRCTDQLGDLREADLTGRRGKEIMDLVAKAEHAEWEADKAEYALSKKIFTLEEEIRPADLFLWSKVVTQLGKLANHADKTAERLRRMIVR